MESVRRYGPRSPRGFCRLVPVNVDRSGDRSCHGDLPGACEAGRAGRGRSPAGPLVCLSRGRLVDQPIARPPIATAFGRPDPLSPGAFTKDLVVLRDLRGPGGSLVASRQLSGVSRCRGCASHVADQHGACAARESVRVRLRLHSRRTTHRAHHECIPHYGIPGTAPGPLLQLVRHTISTTAAPSLCIDGG